MYKLLATSALVAAGLWGTTEAAFAQAKVAPISVVVGGYHEQSLVFARNRSNVIYAVPLGPNPNVRPTRVTQYSDSEIWFGGRTTLANGITVGFDVQLEGNTSSTDQIDESYLFIDGAFGRLVLGSENSVDYIMNYSIPGVGRAYGALESAALAWIIRPVAVTILDTVQSGKGSGGGGNVLPNLGNDQQRVSYFTPRFFGFQGGVSYTPNVTGTIFNIAIANNSFEDVNSFTDRTVNRHNAVHGAINYTNNFSGFQVNASGGISYYPKLKNATTAPANDSVIDWSLGAQVGFAGFLVGGGYRNLDVQNGAEDGYAWGAGVSWTGGPFVVGLNYLTSKVEGSSTNSGEDKFRQIMLAAGYTLGPGVDLIGSVFHLRFRDEGGASANRNSGAGVAVGMRLSF